MDLTVGRTRGLPTISLSASRSSYACGLSGGEDPTKSPSRGSCWTTSRARKGCLAGQSFKKMLMSSAVAVASASSASSACVSAVQSNAWPYREAACSTGQPTSFHQVLKRVLAATSGGRQRTPATRIV